VVGSDLCAGVPIEALMLDDGRLLGEAVAVDHTASLPLGVAMARANRPVPYAQAAMLLWASTDHHAPGPDAAAVPGFEFPPQFLGPLRDAYRNADTVVGPNATAGAFRTTRFTDFDVLHIVAHHVQGRRGQAESGLLMEDGVVRRRDLLAACKGLVILSACGAGSGPVRAGEGDAFHSFVGACLWNGAQAVIASRRDLLVLDHLRTMVHCHERLAQGDCPARAMQRARLTMVSGADLVTRVQRAMIQVFGAGNLPLIAR
jgi:CHAT domain-containing protein